MIIDRLTAKDIVAGVEIFDLKVGVYEEKAFNLLGQYEDTGLTPADVAELVQAKKIRMLCDIGDTVWFIVNDYCPIQQKKICFVQNQKITRIIFDENIIEYRTASMIFRQEHIGKTVFLTKAEAQAALERMEGLK